MSSPYEKTVEHIATVFSLSSPPELRPASKKFFLEWLDEHDRSLYPGSAPTDETKEDD